MIEDFVLDYSQKSISLRSSTNAAIEKFSADYETNVEKLRGANTEISSSMLKGFNNSRFIYISQIQEFLSDSHNQVYETLQVLETELHKELSDIVDECEMQMDSRQT